MMNFMDVEREAATFFRELKTEVDACRRQVVALTDELHAQRVGFAAYKARTEAQLSELREHNTTLGCCVVLALRMEANEAGNGKKNVAATCSEGKAEAPDRGMEDNGLGFKTEDHEKIDASRVKNTSATVEDKKIRKYRSIAEECHAMNENGRAGGQRAARHGTALAAGPTNPNLNPNHEEIGAARVSVTSETSVDKEIRTLRKMAAEYEAVMKMEEPTGDSRPGTPGKALAVSPTLDRAGPARKPSLVLNGIGSDMGDREKFRTAHLSVTAETTEDYKIRRYRNFAEEYDAVMTTEESAGEMWPRKPSPTPKRAGLQQKPSPDKKMKASGKKKSASVSGDSTDIAKDRVMRQRIFLLRHASRCTAPEGTCPTRNCAETKAVWNHIINDGCTDPNCSVRHCVSSRYVIRNYQSLSYQPLSRGAVCHAAVKRSESVRRAWLHQ